VRAIREAAPRAEIFEVMLRAGHFGLVVGSRAMKSTWPTVARWVRWREGEGRRPATIRSAKAVDDSPTADETPRADVVWDLVRDVAQGLGGAVGNGARSARGLLSNVARQFPLISRLAGIRRDTRIGLSLTLSEQAESNPDGTFFLFGGRAYTYAAADRRVDAVARGLLSVGVRQGEHVGIYMNSRPSALALTAAVNRLGAVAVLLRPDGPLEIEAGLAAINHIIADPEHAESARDTLGQKILVLGGGGEPRQLARDLIDMEAIDPDRVVLPDWYRPSPGRAEEVAFILFAGSGAGVVANRITNRRWAQSAFGTASAADMTSTDGVYCWTPIHHPTGLLVSISSALVSGARLALADGFSAERFWGEVRRYGTSIVFYTGTICRELVDAPPDAAEHGHPVRLFAGSGMPGPIWQRLLDRFGPVGVLEFYASTQGNAVLANVAGEKIGSAGRPLPGSAEVAIASYDPIKRALLRDESGYCIAAREAEIGLLLARVDVDRGAIEGNPMRSVFKAGDAWYATDQLCRKDADGDLFVLEHLADVIRRDGIVVPSIEIEAAAWQLDRVSAAAAYGIRLDDPDDEVVALAIVLRPNTRLAPAELLDAFRHQIAAENYPRIVRLVDEIPMTQGHRFRKQPLRDRGLPDGTAADGKAFWYDAESRCYRRVDVKSAAELRTALASPVRHRRPVTKRPRRTRRAVSKT
jgi:putative long chain acyl-CoA synthase